MAFSRTGLRRIAFGGAAAADGAPRKILHYVEAATLAAMAASGYFDALIAELAVGDVLLLSASDGVTLGRITSVTTHVAFEVAGVELFTAQTAVPKLTENSTTIGGTQDNNFSTLSVAWNGSTDPTAAEGALLIDAIRECAKKINAILDVLNVAGLPLS